MNLNVKLDGEEEQPLQYVNRFAFNIPSSAFNLNIVNPGLSNQSYILNPMNSVGQSIVTYQPPMALQSYIALPTEAEGNIIHSLPVGVPMPVGLPVSTGLLQNNFMNTSIIIGNEDCNSQGVIKTATNNLNSDNEIKINYIEEPMEQLNHCKPNGIEVQNIGLNCSPQATTEIATIKKPCPLEMSIKAANIDIEFEKCEPGIPILLDNCHAVVGKQPLLVEHVPLESELKTGVIKVPFGVAEVASVEPPSIEVKDIEKKKIKTEITWENNNKQGSADNGFQESLICEVEEANDDEDEVEEEDYEDEDEEVEEEEEDEEEKDDDDDDDDDDDYDDDDEEEEEEEGESETEKGVSNTNCKSVDSSEGLSSSEESDSLPLSVAFRLDKSSNSKSNKFYQKGKHENLSYNKVSEFGKSKQKKSQRNKKLKEESEEENKVQQMEEECDDWSDSDDDVLNLKRIKNEFNYKCFYEPKTAKSGTSLVLKIDNKFKKFVRIRSCCSKRQCGKKITVQDQKAAQKNFYDLESNIKRDAYLMNCIEYVQKNKNVDNAKDKANEQLLTKLEEETNIQLEIENESNGNQKLSDEIQKAINESLKDCVANDLRDKEGKCNEVDLRTRSDGIERAEKNSWNFYVVIDKCRKKVCLQFLLKLFQVPKSRIKFLQKKILSGSPLVEESTRTSQKSSHVWDLAKSHLESLENSECLDCRAKPRHRFLTERRTKEDLFNTFRNYYFHKLGKGPNIKYASYKRFLDKKTSLSFALSQEGVCSACEELKRHEKRKQSKAEKTKRGKECKKQWVIKRADSEDRSSDDEPLLKRKKLKLTIPLKAVDGKTQQNAGKRAGKKYSVEHKSKGKSKQSGNRGRDVWSLMLLHLETMPYKECKGCVSKKRHRFLDPSFTTQGLFEDYRKYFLKETNSELGLGFTMYEKYFNRNCNYVIAEVDINSPNCPSCATATKS